MVARCDFGSATATKVFSLSSRMRFRRVLRRLELRPPRLRRVKARRRCLPVPTIRSVSRHQRNSTYLVAIFRAAGPARSSVCDGFCGVWGCGIGRSVYRRVAGRHHPRWHGARRLRLHLDLLFVYPVCSSAHVPVSLRVGRIITAITRHKSLWTVSACLPTTYVE